MDAVRKPGSEVLRFDQSGELLRKVMETAAVGMVLIGVDRRLLYVNGAFCDMFGYEREAALGLDVDAILLREPGEAGPAIAGLLDGHEETFRLESRFRHRDGHDVWMLAAGAVLRSERTGRPLYAILQLSSIEQQKRAEAALGAAESRWGAALEAAGQGVWDHDARTGGIYYSPTWRRMRGIPLDEHVDPAREKWLARVHPEDRARIDADVNRQERGEDGFDIIEYRERHRDGHYIWILSRGRPVEWDRKGKAIRTIGTDTDITRVKAAEAAVAEERERLRVTLQSIGDGVITTDARGCITFMNPIAEEMTGWTFAAAVGRTVDEVFAIAIEGGPAATPLDPVATAFATGRPCYLDAEVVLQGRSGERRDIRCSAAPVRMPDGGAIGAVLVFQDVTHARALQKKLAHSANHDPLTDLPNRAAFERSLSEAVEEAQAGQRVHALCFIDLDHFKPVNDTAGHAAGDALLRKVAQVIRRSCREGDVAARIGGDEFALLLLDCSAENAVAAAEKIVRVIAGLRFAWQGRTYRIGASIGVTAIGAASESPEPIAEADTACYEAKARGRGQVVLFGEAPPNRRGGA
jgi:diguanylate cyclase (GGDEF)-like protein/PAS domain S-box-containing protein